jgi:hypothetical protein
MKYQVEFMYRKGETADVEKIELETCYDLYNIYDVVRCECYLKRSKGYDFVQIMNVEG